SGPWSCSRSDASRNATETSSPADPVIPESAGLRWDAGRAVKTDEHRHGIAIDPSTDRRALRTALVLIVAFMAVEVVSGMIAGSLALLADAGHMLADAGALGAALWASHLAARPATSRWTYGMKRAEILAAGINGVTLAAVAAVLFVEAIQRLV